MEILDPIIATLREDIEFAPRPQILMNWRIGLIENTPKNPTAVLRQVAAKRDRRAVDGAARFRFIHPRGTSPTVRLEGPDP